MKKIFLQTPSKPGVLVRKTFSYTPDEARSVGLAKACVFYKYIFCYRENQFQVHNSNRMRNLHAVMVSLVNMLLLRS